MHGPGEASWRLVGGRGTPGRVCGSVWPFLCFWLVPDGTCLFKQPTFWISLEETPPLTASLAWRTPEGLGGR